MICKLESTIIILKIWKYRLTIFIHKNSFFTPIQYLTKIEKILLNLMKDTLI